MRRHIIFAIALAAASTIVGTGPVLAQDDVGFRGWGPRVGLTIDPDQVHFGAHLDFGNFAQRLRFQPNIELGLGDDLTVAALNAETNYRFAATWDVWTPYLGGGLGVNFIGDDEDGLRDESDTEVGLNLLGGIERGLANGDRFFVEGKIGLQDLPDFKATVGWTFFP